jgi:hypothetical protein
MSMQHTFTRSLGTAIVVGAAAMLWLAPSAALGSPAPEEAAADPRSEQRGDDEATVAVPTTEPPVYQPPRRGAPKTRVGGGTRDLGSGELPAISLLAPESTGLTSRASPSLFWHLSKAYDGEFEFVIVDRDAASPEPVFRQRVTRRFEAGFHRIDLAAQGVELQPRRVYQWSVALIRDPQRRSHDIVALATVERVAAEPAAGDVNQLARAGLWYDAIEALDPPPTTSREQTQLGALLRQVGLGVGDA